MIQLAQGGSGVGNPIDRDVSLVWRDVLHESISIEKARDVYKVVIDPGTLEVDLGETRRLRAEAALAQAQA